jgi:hypothetical protein
MTNHTVTIVRRSLLRGAFALLGIAASGASQSRDMPVARRPGRDELLFDRAAALVAAQFERQGDTIGGPVSLLQRELRLGYGAALVLAERLEQAGLWQVFHDAGGMRCARRGVNA